MTDACLLDVETLTRLEQMLQVAQPTVGESMDDFKSFIYMECEEQIRKCH